jgi:hypothetical protein
VADYILHKHGNSSHPVVATKSGHQGMISSVTENKVRLQEKHQSEQSESQHKFLKTLLPDRKAWERSQRKSYKKSKETTMEKTKLVIHGYARKSTLCD